MLASTSSYIHLLLRLPGTRPLTRLLGETDRQCDIYLQVMESTCKDCIADLEGTAGRQGGRQAGRPTSPWSHGEGQ